MPRPHELPKGEKDFSPSTLYRDAQAADRLARYAKHELRDADAAEFFELSAEALRGRARREAERRRLKAFWRRAIDERLWNPLGFRE